MKNFQKGRLIERVLGGTIAGIISGLISAMIIITYLGGFR